MKTIKIITLSILFTLTNQIFAQDGYDCGNCNEKYLKVRTFGGTNVISLNKTYYVFYKLYTPNERTCFSQNTAQSDVVEAFQEALKNNKKYQELLSAYEAKNGSPHSSKNYLVGRAVHFTDDHNSILDPFKGPAKTFNYNIEYIELDFDIEALFSDYILCN